MPNFGDGKKGGRGCSISQNWPLKKKAGLQDINDWREVIKDEKSKQNWNLTLSLVVFYGISTFVGYLQPNPAKPFEK